MAKNRTKKFIFVSLSIFISTIAAILLIEAACYFLNRAEVKFPGSTVPNLDAYNGGAKTFEVPNSVDSLKVIAPLSHTEYLPQLRDTSLKELPNYNIKNARDVVLPRPNQKSRSILTTKPTGQVIYDVNYSIDENSRRVTPQDNLNRRKKHLLLLGCSFTFGEGVNDSETLPAQIAANDPNFHVYNLGYSAFSPSSLWLESKYGSWMNDIREPEGAAVYVFLEDHLRRVFGPMDLVARWGEELPYLEVDDSGNLKPNGTFVSGRPFTTWLYKFLWNTEMREFFNFNYPNVFTKPYLHRFGLLVQRLKEVYFEKTGSKNFYVVFYPGNSTMGMGLIYELDRLGIKFLNYGAFRLETVTPEPFLPHDLHPTPAAHRIFGKLIAKDLLQQELK